MPTIGNKNFLTQEKANILEKVTPKKIARRLQAAIHYRLSLIAEKAAPNKISSFLAIRATRALSGKGFYYYYMEGLLAIERQNNYNEAFSHFKLAIEKHSGYFFYLVDRQFDQLHDRSKSQSEKIKLTSLFLKLLEIPNLGVSHRIFLLKKIWNYYSPFIPTELNVLLKESRSPHLLRLKYIDFNIVNTYPKHLIEQKTTYKMRLPKGAENNHGMSSYETPVPELKIFEIEEVNVSRSDFQIYDDLNLYGTEPAANPFKGFVAGCHQTLLPGDRLKKQIGLIVPSMNHIPVGEAILLGGRCSANYFHWLIEYMGRFFSINHPSFKNTHKRPTLIIPDNLYPQQLEVLELLNIQNLPVLELKKDQVVHAEKLFVPTLHTYMPDNLEDPYWKVSTVSEKVLTYLRNEVFEQLRINVDSNPRRRVYLSRRNNPSRAIVNEEKLEEVVRSYDFEIVYPETLSFADQVSLMNETQALVSPSGAALANLIFANPKMKILAMAADINHDYCMFSNLAHFAGASYEVICGKLVNQKRSKYRTEQDYRFSPFKVNPTKLKQAIERSIY